MADEETEGTETEETEQAEQTPDGDGDGEEGTGKVDWKSQSRKHERRARQERKAREDAEKQLRDRDEMDKSTQEKAVEAARQEGEKTAREEADKLRRGDRLEAATIRLASTGLKVKDADGNEQTLRFADPDDAHTYVERMLRRGDLDEEELFDDGGKIQNAALSEALAGLLEAKPHLAANGGGGGSRKVTGSADGGKGSGGGKGVEDMSTAEHFERIRQTK